MQRAPRLKKRNHWFWAMLISFAVLALITAATLSVTLPSLKIGPAQRGAAVLHDIAVVQTVAGWLPSTTPADPLYQRLAPAFAALVIFAIAAARFDHHRRRFKQEEHAREMQDL